MGGLLVVYVDGLPRGVAVTYDDPRDQTTCGLVVF